MKPEHSSAEYEYRNPDLSHTHTYLLPSLKTFLASTKPDKVFELGCGNGAVAGWMSKLDIDVTAIDYSETGVRQANLAHPQLRIEVGSAYDDLAEKYGKYPVVVSLEVIEHLYEPRKLLENVFNLLQPGGHAFISTPYHGYLKNLALAITGKMDAHFTALWDGGHIKFFSPRTLETLLTEAGFIDIEFLRVGRVPVLAKSMIAIARKP
jgi:2-polyprenyl-3-methyl-5-hydroxy-6-metoxy-1,4-benzoquinol methylase